MRLRTFISRTEDVGQEPVVVVDRLMHQKRHPAAPTDLLKRLHRLGNDFTHFGGDRRGDPTALHHLHRQIVTRYMGQRIGRDIFGVATWRSRLFEHTRQEIRRCDIGMAVADSYRFVRHINKSRFSHACTVVGARINPMPRFGAHLLEDRYMVQLCNRREQHFLRFDMPTHPPLCAFGMDRIGAQLGQHPRCRRGQRRMSKQLARHIKEGIKRLRMHPHLLTRGAIPTRLIARHKVIGFQKIRLVRQQRLADFVAFTLVTVAPEGLGKGNRNIDSCGVQYLQTPEFADRLLEHASLDEQTRQTDPAQLQIDIVTRRPAVHVHQPSAHIDDFGPHFDGVFEKACGSGQITATLCNNTQPHVGVDVFWVGAQHITIQFVCFGQFIYCQQAFA